MRPCEASATAEYSFWRTVTFAISCSDHERTTDIPRRSGRRRRGWRRAAIYMMALFPMLQGCSARKTPTSDHFDGSRFHNRAGGSEYSFWEEIEIGWELRTKEKNWPARFEPPAYRAPADPV